VNSEPLDPHGLGVEQALRAAQGGDVSAFNALVEVYQRQVYNICYRTLGHADDAADATQDALLSAFRGLRGFHGPANGLRAWLLRIAVNTCYDHLRRRKRRPVDSLDALAATVDPERDSALSPSERLPDPEPGPEERSLGAESARLIQAALERLPHEQRMTVVLCDVQGLSYEEVAHAMQVELGTVKSRLSRARAHLRDLLAAQGELPTGSRRLEERNQ
jgi:RNA polymerase sigma-70 factor, ECF subfamily